MRRLRERLGLAATIGAVLLACGCTAAQQQAAPTSSVYNPQPAPGSATGSTAAPARPSAVNVAAIDMSNPEAVAQAAAMCSLQWDTAADANEYDAAYRAAALMTPELAATFAPTGQGRNADPRWSAAASAKAYSVPELYSGQPTHDAPTDTATAIYRTYEASWSWVGADGETTSDPRTRYLYLTVSQQPDGRWLVSTFDHSDI